MAEFDPTTLRNDELYLAGRLQINIARTALVLTGINQAGEKMLTGFLNVHERLARRYAQPDNPEGNIAQSSIAMFLQGETAQVLKTDLITGLRHVIKDESQSQESKSDAQALLEYLVATQPSTEA